MKSQSEPLIGNKQLVNFLDKLVVLSERQSIGGSFIFAGPSGAGKKTLANYFIGKLFCRRRTAEGQPCRECDACRQLAAGVNPDVYWLRLAKNKKNIAVDEARQLIRSLGLSSFASGYKAAVIEGAEKLSHQAANALLKTLEEPTAKTIIILLVNNVEDLPLTIASRSQTLNFRPAPLGLIYDHLVAERRLKRSQAKNLAALSLGSPGTAIKFLEEPDYLAEHLAAAEFFFQAPALDLNGRLGAVEELAAEDAAAVSDLLTVWQAVVRDWLLINLGQGDLRRYQILADKTGFTASWPTAKLLAWQRSLAQAREYVAANVNPKLVVENFLINL